MVDSPYTDPVPEHLSTAFAEAIVALQFWDGTPPQPLVPVRGKRYTIEAMCGPLRAFPEPAPQGVIENLNAMASEMRGGQEAPGHTCEGPADGSYASAARCLVELYATRRALFAASSTRRVT
jgi:hypothetical protein